ncbi:Fpg/Nei family DNA glycosylase [Rhodococcus sp. D2-41]|uniref:DNA-(apurinic or apyrimidinic site) lyase n=1 Tax=Speluncibacter jeojiensis TaxID=2710754 RepID=A0A9X4M1F1_9ACTN|nr:DNA-formamidopyrimidine glycosylase family protein [Rhodococcus sp. D2-41]MDG3012675.1 Fpg/Nei family DNA glycosylase [Rhodococcus sp. D2-41]MDG3015220.1 Fpg/Nei family DNA glycosylase [Corynebacteriales bacterium D3-21]
MPEGDTVWQAARLLDRALSGKTLRRCDIRVPTFATVDLAGQVVDSAVSRGKHLLIRVGDFDVHTHLKMEGQWQIHPVGSRWRRPAHQARIVFATDDVEAVGFSLGVTEVFARAEESERLAYLGPDLLGPDWDPARAVRNLRADPDRLIGTTLLDQRNLAGIGNEYLAEVCFLRGVDPRRPAGEVGDVTALVDLAHRLFTANRDRPIRTTTGDTRRGRRTWVYGRANLPCRRCGTTIETGMLGDDPTRERRLFVCPHCQR